MPAVALSRVAARVVESGPDGNTTDLSRVGSSQAVTWDFARMRG